MAGEPVQGGSGNPPHYTPMTELIAPVEKETTAAQPRRPREGLRWQTLLIGLLASTFLVSITPFNDLMVQGTYIAGSHFPFGAFSVLLLLTLLVNPLLRKIRAAWALSSAQLIAIWAIIAVPSGIPSSGLMRYLVPNMTALSYFSTPENKWEHYFGEMLTSPLRITDQMVVRSFFEGLPVGSRLPWHAWAAPMAAWGIYAIAMYVMMIGLSVVLRRRWVEHERFTFPLVQVPFEVARAPQPTRLVNDFLLNPWVWVAVLLVTVIHTFNGLHGLYPQVPLIKLMTSISFTERPWSWASSINVSVYPLAVGFGYLLTTEVLFSMWFFRLFYAAQSVLFGWLGLPNQGLGGYGGQIWATHEEAGATLGLAGWFLWIGRDYFGDVFRQAFSNRRVLDDSQEPLRYRAAVFALLLGALVMVAWLTYFGGNLALALANVVLGICVFITLGWAIAQGGLIYIQPTFSTTQVMTSLFGSSPFGVKPLLINMLNEQVNRMDLREYMLPSLLNAHRACDEVNLDRRALLLKGLIPSIGLALVAAGLASIALPYLAGGGISLPNAWTYQWAPRLTYNWTSQLVLKPFRPDPGLISHFGAGMAATLLVLWMRKNFSWFSLHPIGFLIASGYPLDTMWFSLFLAWVIKTAVMKYGGYKVYQDLRPLFLGLIIGDTLNGAVWIVIGLVTKTGYMLLPG